jgi:hypothetical protein
MVRILLVIFLSTTIYSSSFGQIEELFDGENTLSECRIDLPLTFKKKDKPVFEKSAIEMKGILLSRVYYNSKTGKVTYKNYYVVIEGEFVYLMKPKDYENNSGMKKAIFPPNKEKENRYYKANCFEEKIANNETLKQIVKENTTKT